MSWHKDERTGWDTRSGCTKVGCERGLAISNGAHGKRICGPGAEQHEDGLDGHDGLAAAGTANRGRVAKLVSSVVSLVCNSEQQIKKQLSSMQGLGRVLKLTRSQPR